MTFEQLTQKRDIAANTIAWMATKGYSIPQETLDEYQALDVAWHRESDRRIKGLLSYN